MVVLLANYLADYLDYPTVDSLVDQKVVNLVDWLACSLEKMKVDLMGLTSVVLMESLMVDWSVV